MKEQNRLLSSPQPIAELDLDKIKKKLDLANEGRERGKKNLPSENAKPFDETEQKIIALIETEQQNAQQTLNDQLNLCQQTIAGLDLENEAINIVAVGQRASSEFTVKVDAGKAALSALWRNVTMIEKQLNDFRQQHGLKYLADYPLSRLWNFSIIIVILALESILNGSFLARGLETGLLGGVMQAFVIAAANVSFGFFVGDTVIRYLMHRNLWLRLLAIVELPASCAISVFFNLMVGHYRDALGGPDPMNASSAALHSFTAHPFALDAFQSWVLFGMGIFFCMVAAADGFKMDDPYPGYGKISRKHEEAVEEYADERANVIGDLARTRDRALHVIQEESRNLGDKRAALSRMLDNRARYIQYFEAYQAYLSRAANDLLGFYRSANMQARSAAAPDYFNESFELEKPQMAAIAAMPNEALFNAHIEKSSAALKTAINQVNSRFEEAAGAFRAVAEKTEEHHAGHQNEYAV